MLPDSAPRTGDVEIGLCRAAVPVGEDDVGVAGEPGHVLLGRFEGLEAIVARPVADGLVPRELGGDEGRLAEDRLALQVGLRGEET